jgi:peptidyl-prolyl cis-trans isomerase C
MRALLTAMSMGLLCVPAMAQETPAPPAGVAPAADAVAATVNGVAIPEGAVQRVLKTIPPDKHAEARPDILNFLISNALVDQYLLRAKIAVEDKEVDAKVQLVKDEIKNQGSNFEKEMKQLMLTEGELRYQIAGQLRWEKFATAQATDKALRDYFERNPDMFDGSMVRARHILLTPPAGNAEASAQAKAELAAIKRQVEDAAAKALASLPANADNLEREKARVAATDNTFADLARKKSACPSKVQGGDLGLFPRAGNMVEPFARAAFALKPYEMSDIVATQYGYHLILVTERRPGRPTKFEDIKDDVREVYSERLREVVVAQLRPVAKIVINSPAAPTLGR